MGIETNYISEHGESQSGGLKPMAIEGRMSRTRERCIGMTDAERAWRAKWVKDQILHADEPKIPEAYYKERFNPIRRFYRFPLDKFERAIFPMMVLLIFFLIIIFK